MVENSHWKNVVRLKYGTKKGGWFTKDPRGSYRAGPWKVISKEVRQLKQDCGFELRDGRRIRFW